MRNSWKKLAFKGAVGALLFLMANVVVYYSSGFFQRERHYHRSVAELFGKPDVSIVLMGDSHVAEIPDELLAPGTHNLAAGGDGYREIYAKLRYVLAGSQRVQTLLLTADYHMFGTGRVQSANRSFVERYLLATQSGAGYEKNWLSSLFNLAPLFNDDFVQYLKKDAREMLRRTPHHGGVETAWADLPDATREERALRTGRGDHSGVGAAKQPIYWFEQILQLARQHDIDVILVRYPTSAGYLAQIPVDGKAIVDAQLARVAAPAVVDLSHALSEPAYFVDEDHVNSRGAAVLLCLLEERTALHLGGAASRQECSVSPERGHMERVSR